MELFTITLLTITLLTIVITKAIKTKKNERNENERKLRLECDGLTREEIQEKCKVLISEIECLEYYKAQNTYYDKCGLDSKVIEKVIIDKTRDDGILRSVILHEFSLLEMNCNDRVMRQKMKWNDKSIERKAINIVKHHTKKV